MSFLRAWRERVRRSAPRGKHSRRLVVEALEDRTLPSTLTVLTNADSGAGSLRALITAAQSGDQIVFDSSLQGQTIRLTNGELAITKSLDVEGLGADQLAISGNHQSRIFNVSGGVTVTIAGLTITDGLGLPGATGPGSGGGIENTGSHLTVVDDTFSDNEALGSGGNGNGRGGAIDSVSGATLTVTHCLFLHNLSTGSNGAAAGAINCNGSATVSDSTFIGNQSITASGGQASFSRGGAIYNSAGTLTVVNSTFTGNQALGGSNNAGSGLAFGCGIANTEGGVLFLSGSTFTNNQALGGSQNTSPAVGRNPGSAWGGGLHNLGVASITNTTFEHNEAVGGSGNTGAGGFDEVGCAFGGGISTTAASPAGAPGVLTASNLTLRNNRAVGGAGNTGGIFVGEAIGGGLFSDGSNPFVSSGGSTATISNSTIADNQAVGGQGDAGGNGSDGLGGGAANIFGGVLTISGSMLSGNQALGGAGGAGGNGGNAFGGGLFNDGPSTYPGNVGAPTVLTVLDSRIAHNEA